MAKRTLLLAAMIACLLCAVAGRSVADGPLPQARHPIVAAPAPTGLGAVSPPTGPAFYRFTGHPVIRAWSSVPRRT